MERCLPGEITLVYYTHSRMPLLHAPASPPPLPQGRKQNCSAKQLPDTHESQQSQNHLSRDSSETPVGTRLHSPDWISPLARGRSFHRDLASHKHNKGIHLKMASKWVNNNPS